MHRPARLSTCVIAIAALLVGCSSSPTGSTSSAPVELGFSGSFTGPFAAAEKSLREGFDAYVKSVNAAGGVNGRPVHVTYLDDTSTGPGAAANFTRLVNENKVLAVTGPVASAPCDSMAQVAQARSVPLLCFVSGLDTVNPAKPYVFVTQAQTADFARPTLDVAHTLVTGSSKRAVVLSLTSATSAPYNDATTALFKQDGWETLSLKLDASNPNVSAQLAQITSFKPDIVTGNIIDAQTEQLLTALANANLNPPVVEVGGNPSFTVLSKHKSDRLYAINQWGYANPIGDGSAAGGVKAYLADTKAAGVSPEGQFTAIGYFQAEMLVAAVKTCGSSCTAQSLRDALESTTVDSDGVMASKGSFSATRHNALANMGLYVWDSSTSYMKLAKADLQAGR